MSGITDLTWETLEPLGFLPEERPASNFMPAIPPDITEMGEEVLMILFAEMTEWSCYAASQLADARSREAAAEQALSSTVAAASVLAKSERTVAAQKAVAAANPAVMDAEEEALRAAATRRALEAVHSNSERRAQLLSRELSRRIAGRDRDTRTAKWSA